MQGIFNAHDFQARRCISLGVAGRGDLTVAKIALGIADATHLQAFAQQRLEALANDEFGTAAADIGHQALARRIGQGVGHTKVDQARFFAPGDDFHGMAEDFFGAANELATIARLAQGVGANDTHRPQGQAVDQLGKALEAVEPALHGLFAEPSFFIDAGGQLNLLSEPLKNADLAMDGLGQDHMEAVGAQVDGSDQGKILG
ncbi:hypothetical protein D9M71_225520 [compost metagenome]